MFEFLSFELIVHDSAGGGGFQGCYLNNHRNNWRCARAVPALCENAPLVPCLPCPAPPPPPPVRTAPCVPCAQLHHSLSYCGRVLSDVFPKWRSPEHATPSASVDSNEAWNLHSALECGIHWSTGTRERKRPRGLLFGGGVPPHSPPPAPPF